MMKFTIFKSQFLSPNNLFCILQITYNRFFYVKIVFLDRNRFELGFRLVHVFEHVTCILLVCYLVPFLIKIDQV